jgi:hypothetical protein
MGHRIPLHGGSLDDRVRHRQAMVNMAPNGRGFRPNFMEITLVQFGHADASLLLPDRSERSKRKAKAKVEFLAALKKQRADRHARGLSD